MAIQNLWDKNFKGTLILKVKMQCDNNVDLQSFVFHSFLENVCTAHNALKYKSSFCKWKESNINDERWKPGR